MEKTITSILEETKEVREKLEATIKVYNDSLEDFEKVIQELDNEISDGDTNSVYELRQHKSSLLQSKSGLIDQLNETKELLETVKKSIDVYEKIIQLKSGDIF